MIILPLSRDNMQYWFGRKDPSKYMMMNSTKLKTVLSAFMKRSSGSWASVGATLPRTNEILEPRTEKTNKYLLFYL
jgi:hypothetical protein